MITVEEEKIGEVTHYFNKIGVAIIKLTQTLKVGEEIHLKGASTDFKQTVESMQVEHESIEEAQAGETIGLKVKEPVRERDEVLRTRA